MFPALSPGREFLGLVPWYSLLIVTGIIISYLLCTHEEKRLSLKKDTVLDLALLVVPMGILGGRLYYVAFSWSIYADDPLSILYIWEGGLAIYGAIIGGAAAILLFSWLRKMNPFLMLDIVAPSVVLSQAIGRWGNYFNMEAYGAEIADPAWQFFPAGVQIPSGNGYVWHMATFFYESMWNLLVFLVLWFVIRRVKKHHGVVTLWYLMLYGVGRFFIEGFRTDSLMTGSIRVSQMLSAALAVSCCAALAAIALLTRKKPEA